MAVIYEQADGRWAAHAADGSYIGSFATKEEARMADMTTDPPVLRWQRLSLEQIARGAALVDGLAPSHRLGPAVQAAIDAAAPGVTVEGGSWTKEEAAEVMQLWTALEAFLATPLGEGGPTPLDIITRYA